MLSIAIKNIVATTTSKIKLTAKRVQGNCILLLAYHPYIALLLAITISVLLLPAIMIIALTPLAVFSYYLGIVTAGGVGLIYNVLFKGFLLAVLFTTLVTAGFVIATCISVMHSYNLFLFRWQDKYCYK